MIIFQSCFITDGILQSYCKIVMKSKTMFLSDLKNFKYQFCSFLKNNIKNKHINIYMIYFKNEKQSLTFLKI